MPAMQSKQSLAMRAIRSAAVLVSLGSVVLGAEPSPDQWVFPWTPLERQTLSVHGDPRDVGGVTLHTLRVTDRAGTQLLTYDGTELMSAAPLRIGPKGDETLLVTHWSGGNHASRLLVLRGAGSK